MCQNNNNTNSRKGKHLKYSERQSIERWWNRDKRTKVEIASLLDRDEKTIRNNIYAGDIYNIKSIDMIYNKEYKDKNKEKTICEKVPPEKSIEYRPKKANTREEIIVKIPGKKAEYVAKALDMIEKKYKNKFYNKFKTITFDNGGEFRNWKSLEKSYDNRRKKPRIQVYYAHPYRSGERGSNENANRLIRRFIPKGIDITAISEEVIQYIENWINNYPRAMFNYKSINEVLKELCA